MMLLALFFSAAMAGQMNNRLLALVSVWSALVIALIGLIVYFFQSANRTPQQEIGSDFGFLLIVSIWAFSIVKKTRILYLGFAIIGFGFSIYFGANNIIGAALGIGGAFAINSIFKMRVSASQKYAVFVALFAVFLTIILIIRGTAIAFGLGELFDSLGARAAFGTGFETAGSSIYAQFGTGLGAIGVGTGFITIFAAIASAYLYGKVTFASSLAILGLGCHLAFSPSQIAFIGPIVLIFIASVYRAIIVKSIIKPRPA